MAQTPCFAAGIAATDVEGLVAVNVARVLMLP
jgi:hypothetical protein